MVLLGPIPLFVVDAFGMSRVTTVHGFFADVAVHGKGDLMEEEAGDRGG
jgi:hypothetical protein